MKKYNAEKRKHLRKYKRDWMRRNRAGKLIESREKERWNARFTLKKDHCRECDKLFSYGGKGDGIICSECVDYHKNGPKKYFSERQYQLE